MRKPVYLTVVGISIVVAACSLGVTLTRYLGLRAYSPKGTAQAAAAPAGPDTPATPPAEWNNLFAPGDGMRMASRLPAMDGKSAPGAARTSYLLVGTIVSSSPEARRAILWANGMKEPKAFREKEEVEPGAFLASVERDKVWITRGNEREKLEILPVGSRARRRRQTRPSPLPRSLLPRSPLGRVRRPPPPACLPDPNRRPPPGRLPTGRRRWPPLTLLRGMRRRSRRSAGRNGADEPAGFGDDGTRRC